MSAIKSELAARLSRAIQKAAGWTLEAEWSENAMSSSDMALALRYLRAGQTDRALTFCRVDHLAPAQ